MLEQNKNLYLTSANILDVDWSSMDKNDLVLECIKHKDTKLYDSYISAIMLRYWNKMLSYYQRCKLVATAEDVHTWLVQAVLYAIERRPWENKNSSIYQDKNGPDKVINRVIESKRLTFYQQLNRYNRKINSVLLSLESLQEDWADANTPFTEESPTIDVDELILSFYKNKDYFFAFLLDAIVYESFLLDKHTKKLVTHLKSLGKEHYKVFATRYDLDENKVLRASGYVSRYPRIVLTTRVKNASADLNYLLKRWNTNCS